MVSSVAHVSSARRDDIEAYAAQTSSRSRLPALHAFRTHAHRRSAAPLCLSPRTPTSESSRDSLLRFCLSVSVTGFKVARCLLT